MDKEQENSQAKLPAKRVLTEKEKQRRVRRICKKKKNYDSTKKSLKIFTLTSPVPMFLTSQNWCEVL